MTSLISPEGKTVEVIWVKPFAKRHGLDPGNLHRVVNGERQHHKGWRVAGAYHPRKPYAIERYLRGSA